MPKPPIEFPFLASLNINLQLTQIFYLCLMLCYVKFSGND